MIKVTTLGQKVDGNQKREFTNALSDMADQLRLMEQKITMITDNRIQDHYETQQQKLHHITYTVNKLHRKQQIKIKKLVPSRFTYNHSKKRLS
ncbi:hypothetical protein SAMN04488072_101349 [Lentibacillus halodurans]|uniref:Uncharacterized protein n=1 Tax=Lentibacillus halodurans TaxID=237679 RepID=A0A1I0VEC0_9BACI|nr:hypothetical protein [Lentibacillus halodurans]SFA74387.1 hypothetical protein SAMN04488072_101349 [Lentibacillus halodurans]